MKQLIATLWISLLATLCYAAEATTPEMTAPETTAAETTALPETAPAEAVSTARQFDSAEVVSADVQSGTLTFKNEGTEHTARIEGKAATALKVVRPGDKVRILYQDEDNNDSPDRLIGVIITDPVRAETTRSQAPQSDEPSDKK